MEEREAKSKSITRELLAGFLIYSLVILALISVPKLLLNWAQEPREILLKRISLPNRMEVEVVLFGKQLDVGNWEPHDTAIRLVSKEMDSQITLLKGGDLDSDKITAVLSNKTISIRTHERFPEIRVVKSVSIGQRSYIVTINSDNIPAKQRFDK